MAEQQVAFNPRAHLMQIGRGDKAQDYLPVQYRLVWVNDVVDRAVADGQDVKLDIDTEEIDCDLDKEFSAEVFVWNNEKRRSEKVVKTANGYAKYKATVTLQIGNMIKRASATKSERAVDFPDFIEKANTGAVGRALAMIGFGTQFAPEFDEGSRIVDAPVDHASSNGTPTTDAQSGYLLPAEIEQIKKDWAEVCNIKEADIPTRWTGFKTHINNGAFVSDPQLTREHKDAMLAYLKPRRKKAS